MISAKEARLLLEEADNEIIYYTEKEIEDKIIKQCKSCTNLVLIRRKLVDDYTIRKYAISHELIEKLINLGYSVRTIKIGITPYYYISWE